jgi:hypothetical protein
MKSFLDWFEGDKKIDPVLRAGRGPRVRHYSPLSMMAMVALRARLQTWLSRAQRMAGQGRKSGRSATPTTTFWNIRRKGPWISVRIEWFLGCLGRAIDAAHETLSAILAKARFCDRIVL